MFCNQAKRLQRVPLRGLVLRSQPLALRQAEATNLNDVCGIYLYICLSHVLVFQRVR